MQLLKDETHDFPEDNVELSGNHVCGKEMSTFNLPYFFATLPQKSNPLIQFYMSLLVPSKISTCLFADAMKKNGSNFDYVKVPLFQMSRMQLRNVFLAFPQICHNF
jgi:hypothetical protein